MNVMVNMSKINNKYIRMTSSIILEHIAETYSEPYQTSEMERFAKIVNG